jgi:hypothetical protein
MRAALSRLSTAHWPQAFDNLQQASADVSIILLARWPMRDFDSGYGANRVESERPGSGADHTSVTKALRLRCPTLGPLLPGRQLTAPAGLARHSDLR